MSKAKKYDFIIFGATSFVGQILSAYLINDYAGKEDFKWAAAGRSEAKLKQLRQELGDKAQDLHLVIADAADEAALKKMVAQTKVIISTVGPYALYGEPLVKICAESGTDYCDLTGEVQWVGQMIRKYEKAAQNSSARIVHCCGFDSIPSDLGVYYLQQQALKKFGEPCSEVRMGVKAMKGGISGGTVASMINIVQELTKNPALRKELANPYSLCPVDHAFKARQRNTNKAAFDAEFGSWTAPFLMAGINTRIVHRSNALLDKKYTSDFLYSEAMLMKEGLKGQLQSVAFTSGIAGFMTFAAIKPTRQILEKYVVPKPGEGPDPEAQKKGFYDMRFIGKTASGKKIITKVTGDRDPGYGSTAKMLLQAGLILAKELPQEKKAGGFWTPSTALGDRLIERLVTHAGLTFETL